VQQRAAGRNAGVRGNLQNQVIGSQHGGEPVRPQP
jgi:hypothetical protein